MKNKLSFRTPLRYIVIHRNFRFSSYIYTTNWYCILSVLVSAKYPLAILKCKVNSSLIESKRSRRFFFFFHLYHRLFPNTISSGLQIMYEKNPRGNQYEANIKLIVNLISETLWRCVKAGVDEVKNVFEIFYWKILYRK